MNDDNTKKKMLWDEQNQNKTLAIAFQTLENVVTCLQWWSPKMLPRSNGTERCHNNDEMNTSRGSIVSLHFEEASKNAHNCIFAISFCGRSWQRQSGRLWRWLVCCPVCRASCAMAEPWPCLKGTILKFFWCTVTRLLTTFVVHIFFECACFASTWFLTFKAYLVDNVHKFHCSWFLNVFVLLQCSRCAWVRSLAWGNRVTHPWRVNVLAALERR